MSRATDLFDRIVKEGLTSIDRLIADQAAEELFVEFKGSADSVSKNRLSDDDSSNFARAISAFGNSEGGLLLWGVDARASSSSGELSKKAPLDDAAGFRKRLEAAISRLTSPVHHGIQNVVVLETGGPTGYVATLIPKADFAPIRTLTGKNPNYFIRAGDSFLAAPHAVLEGMFGRRPIGRVWAQFYSQPVGKQSGSDTISISFGIGLANGGITLLERPYISIQPGNAFTHKMLRVNPNNQLKFSYSQTGNSQIYADQDRVIVPGGCEDICSVHFVVNGETKTIAEEIAIEVVLGASNVPPKRFFVRSASDIANSLLAAARSGASPTSDEFFGLANLAREISVD